jgi:hypothetical protein
MYQMHGMSYIKQTCLKLILNIMRRNPENKFTIVSHSVPCDRTYSVTRDLIVFTPKCV